MKIFISRRNVEPDNRLADEIARFLEAQGVSVFLASRMRVGEHWAQEIEEQLQAADCFVVLLSPRSVENNLVRYEVKLAYDLSQQKKLHIFPVRVDLSKETKLSYDLESYLYGLHFIICDSTPPFEGICQKIFSAIQDSAGQRDEKVAAGSRTEAEPQSAAKPEPQSRKDDSVKDRGSRPRFSPPRDLDDDLAPSLPESSRSWYPGTWAPPAIMLTLISLWSFLSFLLVEWRVHSWSRLLGYLSAKWGDKLSWVCHLLVLLAAAAMAWFIVAKCSSRPGPRFPRLYAVILAITCSLTLAYSCACYALPGQAAARPWLYAVSAGGFWAVLALSPRVTKGFPDNRLLRHIAPISWLVIMVISASFFWWLRMP